VAAKIEAGTPRYQIVQESRECVIEGKKGSIAVRFLIVIINVTTTEQGVNSYLSAVSPYEVSGAGAPILRGVRAVSGNQHEVCFNS